MSVTKLIAENRRARFDYFIEETFEAGLVLTGSAKPAGTKAERKADKAAAAAAREADKAARASVRDAEAEVKRWTETRDALDRAMFDPRAADAALAKLTMTELMKRRSDAQGRIDAAEERWLEASAALEAVG